MNLQDISSTCIWDPNFSSTYEEHMRAYSEAYGWSSSPRRALKEEKTEDRTERMHN
jgi:hypothetical protein